MLAMRCNHVYDRSEFIASSNTAVDCFLKHLFKLFVNFLSNIISIIPTYYIVFNYTLKPAC